MRNNRTTRQVRVAYSTPATSPKVHGSVVIGVRSESARPAVKAILAWAVALVGVTATGALATGVPRIDNNQRNAGQLGLVLQECAELSERPGMQNDALFTPNRDPISDARQVFDGQSSVGAFSGSDDLLADVVVNPNGKAGLLAGQLLQEPLGCAGLFALELGSKTTVAITDGLHCGSRVPSPIAVRSDVRYSQVDAKEVPHVGWVGLFGVANGGQVELPIVENQVRLSLPGLQESQLSGTSSKRNLQAPAGGPDGDDALIHVPLQDAVVVGNGPLGSEASSGVIVQPVSVCHLGDASNHYLRCEVEPPAGFVVGELVEIEGSEALSFPCSIGDPIAASISPLQGFLERTKLKVRGLQFDLGSQFHINTVSQHLPAWKSPE